MTPSRTLELLAPCRTCDIGIEAFKHGADAVYIGGPLFSARANAGNSMSEIERLASFAHRFNGRVYMALNTIFSDEELPEAVRLAHQAYHAGVDALIVQDMGLLMCDLPPIQLHASTQCDIRTTEKAVFLESIGFSQIVPARELTLGQIQEMAEALKTARIEFFIHGALCVSYSGQCYASQAFKGRSANRGDCAQICRLPFDLFDEEGKSISRGKHLLSLKDNNQSQNLDALIAAGVRSFKIEGRYKDLTYVKNTTAFYRRELDAWLEKHPDFEAESDGKVEFNFEPSLENAFNRGATDYFVNGRNDHMEAFSTPKNSGAVIGQVVKVNDRSFLVKTKKELHNGDGLTFFTDTDELDQFVQIFSGITVLVGLQIQTAHLGKNEHCTLQLRVGICTVNLGRIDLERPVIDLLFRSFASATRGRIVAVFQISFVILTTFIVNLSGFIQNAGIVSVELIVSVKYTSFNGVDNHNRNGKCVAIGRINGNVVVSRVQHSAVINFNGNVRIGLDVRGQLRGHRIVDCIGVAFVTGSIRNSGNGAELNGITDLVITHNTPFAGLIVLDLLIERDRGIFCLDGDAIHNVQHITAIGSTYRHRNSCVLDEVVAIGQVVNGISCTRFSRSVLICREVLADDLGKSVDLVRARGQFGELGSKCSRRRETTQRGRQVRIITNVIAINAVTPNDVTQNLAFQIAGKHLIGFIGMAFSSAIDRKRVAASTSCKRRDRHGANHSNCQQRSHEFLHCFLHGKSPFLF